MNEVRRKSEETLNRTASQIASLRAGIAEFASSEPRTVEAQAIAAQRYGDVTEKMKAKFSQLEVVTKQTRDAEGKRSSLGAAIYHLSIDASHIHIEVQKAQGSFEAQAQRMLKGIGKAQSVCQRMPGESGNATRLRQECSLVSDAATTLTQSSNGVKAAYAILERAWLTKRPEQVALLRQSETFKKQYGLRR